MGSTIQTTTYHSFVYDGLQTNEVLPYIFVAGLVGAFIGVLIGAVLVLTGVFPPSKTLGATELYGRDEDFE